MRIFLRSSWTLKNYLSPRALNSYCLVIWIRIICSLITELFETGKAKSVRTCKSIIWKIHPALSWCYLKIAVSQKIRILKAIDWHDYAVVKNKIKQTPPTRIQKKQTLLFYKLEIIYFWSISDGSIYEHQLS